MNLSSGHMHIWTQVQRLDWHPLWVWPSEENSSWWPDGSMKIYSAFPLTSCAIGLGLFMARYYRPYLPSNPNACEAVCFHSTLIQGRRCWGCAWQCGRSYSCISGRTGSSMSYRWDSAVGITRPYESPCQSIKLFLIPQFNQQYNSELVLGSASRVHLIVLVLHGLTKKQQLKAKCWYHRNNGLGASYGWKSPGTRRLTPLLKTMGSDRKVQFVYNPNCPLHSSSGPLWGPIK